MLVCYYTFKRPYTNILNNVIYKIVVNKKALSYFSACKNPPTPTLPSEKVEFLVTPLKLSSFLLYGSYYTVHLGM